MFCKQQVRVLLLILFISTQALGIQNSKEVSSYKDIYPFSAPSQKTIYSKVLNFTEDNQFIKNFFDIVKADLSKAKTKVKPWTSTYWPLNKGLIADPYENTFLGYYFERGFVSWTKNYSTYLGRKKYILDHVDKLTEGQINTLAPSEKYDLLLGDKNFGLTQKLWEYMKAWGNFKKYGFEHKTFLVGNEFPDPQDESKTVDALFIAQEMVKVQQYGFKTIEEAFAKTYRLNTSLAVKKALELVDSQKYDSAELAWPEALEWAEDESQNYVRERKNNLMAFWEGICHGWSTAAGIVPRPRKVISFKLPDGRNLKFYPTDIKALVSLLWANSLIQDNKVSDNKTGEYLSGGVISAGLRCNQKNVQRDRWGRLYDNKPDPISGGLENHCAGIHPAIWHLSLVNVIGKQGRSFIVDQKVSEEVDNHPLYSYSMKYYNPHNGRYYTQAEKNIVEINSQDQFKLFRNKKAKYIVGVMTKMRYIDWSRPIRTQKDNEAYDKSKTKKMYYDLELDENYDIIGGQWRAVKTGSPEDVDDTSDPQQNLNHNQPDFIWIITKNWKKQFSEINIPEKWTDLTKAPPKSWLEYAKSAHNFKYLNYYEYGTGDTCIFYNRRTGKSENISCEFKTPKPQPLINVINKLVELAKDDE